MWLIQGEKRFKFIKLFISINASARQGICARLEAHIPFKRQDFAQNP